MRDHIERLRAKPVHVRKQVALAASSAVTGVVAVAWLMAMVATGAFSLESEVNEPTFADAASDLTAAVAEGGSFFADDAAPARDITIIESDTETTFDAVPVADDRTVIPF